MSVVVVFVLFGFMFIMDGLLVAMPWLMPQGECFAVTVPAGERRREPLKTYMRSYGIAMTCCSVVCTIPCAVELVRHGGEALGDATAPLFTVLYSVGLLVPVVASFLLMLHYRRRIREVKASSGWRAAVEEAVAIVGPEEDPKPISLVWNLLYVPIVLGCAVVAWTQYDRLPELIPFHMGIDGTVTEFVRKSHATVLFPAMLTAFLGSLFALCHWGAVRSKKPVDPSMPASSAYAYGRFARAFSIVLVVGGIGLTTTAGLTFFASSLGFISLANAGAIMLVSALTFACATTVLSVMLGQSGSRVTPPSPDGSMARDDDALWRLGTFYCNSDDPSIFVPKRFGVGWTVNVARPVVWVVVGVLVLIVVGALFWSAMYAPGLEEVPS